MSSSVPSLPLRLDARQPLLHRPGEATVGRVLKSAELGEVFASLVRSSGRPGRGQPQSLRDVVHQLVAALSDPKPQTRIAALVALRTLAGSADTADALAAVRELASSASGPVRAQAIETARALEQAIGARSFAEAAAPGAQRVTAPPLVRPPIELTIRAPESSSVAERESVAVEARVDDGRGVELPVTASDAAAREKNRDEKNRDERKSKHPSAWWFVALALLAVVIAALD